MYTYLAALSRRSVPRAVLAVSLVSLPFVPGGCKKSSDDEEELLPPTLEFLGAENESGTEFAVDASEVVVSCNQVLTLKLGPNSDGAALLDNWTLRGPGACGAEEQCGYLEFDVLDEDGQVLLSDSQASVVPLLDLSEVALDEIAEFSARLISGESETPFLSEGEEVSARWKVSVSLGECHSASVGGAGGMGGNSAMDPRNVAGAGGAALSR